MKVVALSGGVGGAKLAYGLYHAMPAENLTVIVNIGDDFEHFGLKICPDIDSVLYALAEKNDPIRGWGLADETWETSSALEELGAPTWFQLGDKDLATHLERTRLLDLGCTLTQVTQILCGRLGITARVLPISDEKVPTILTTKDGRSLNFQEYFVRDQFKPEVERISFEGAVSSQASQESLNALHQADLVILCPSNPWISIDPILALPGVREILFDKQVLAVSPIINGKALKGPAAKLFAELGIAPSAQAVRDHYKDFLTVFIYDLTEEEQVTNKDEKGIINFQTNTIMRENSDKVALAQEILRFGFDK